ncbi:MAG TPA: LptA/OstA family protein [Devosia sp.]|jgi:lipopolysaccharide export system protein LptA|nr:LptA/OstA family protein [Devosia sp.]
MIRPLALLLTLLLAAVQPLAAQEKDPVNITADKFVVNDAAQMATFTGKVVVKRNSLTVWAPKVVVEYGDAGPSSIKSFVASGGVRIKTDEQDATGDLAIYDPTAQTLKITGNVMVINASSTVGGPDLVIDLRSNTTVFGGGSSGRVTGVFSTQ